MSLNEGDFVDVGVGFDIVTCCDRLQQARNELSFVEVSVYERLVIARARPFIKFI
jgi:hypothetical protein